MKTPILLPAFGLCLGLALISSCSKSPQSGNTNPVGQHRPSESERLPQIAPVKIQEVQPGAMELSIVASGILRSRHQIPVSSEIPGRVAQKVREIGDAVSAGDDLVLLDSEPYELAVQQAEGSAASAQAAYDQAVKNRERRQRLREGEGVSQFDLENAQLSEKTAQANLQMAQAALKLARRHLRLTHLTSPVDGHVAELEVQIGQQIEPGRSLGLIVSLDQLEIEVSLSEREIGCIKPDSDVRIQTDVYPNSVFTGKVRSAGVAGLDPGKIFPVLISVDNPDRKLKPGMSALVDLIYARPADAICIPRDAIVLSDPDHPAVFVVSGEVARRRPVRIGEGDADHVQVESGLNPGDILVIEGQNALHDSVLVKIL
jgi:RND family efflux transporter MFP subunit